MMNIIILVIFAPMFVFMIWSLIGDVKETIEYKKNNKRNKENV